MSHDAETQNVPCSFSHFTLWKSSSSRNVSGRYEGKPICTASIFLAAVNNALDREVRCRIRTSRSVLSSKCSSRQVRRSARIPRVDGGLLAAPSTLCGLSMGDENREHGDSDSRRA